MPNKATPGTIFITYNLYVVTYHLLFLMLTKYHIVIFNFAVKYGKQKKGKFVIEILLRNSVFSCMFSGAPFYTTILYKISKFTLVSKSTKKCHTHL